MLRGFLNFIAILMLLVSTEGRSATLDLRSETLEDAQVMDVEWEYSDSTIVPGRYKQSGELGRPENFWLESSTLPQRASYRLNILRDVDQPALLLVFKDFPAIRVFVNGHESVERGKLWSKENEGEVEYGRGDANVLLPQTAEIEIILETATQMPRWFRSPQVIKIGEENSFRRQNMLDSMILAIMLGGLFITGIYHISLYVLTPSRSVTLVLGLFCIVSCMRSAITGNVETFYSFFPNFSFELSYKLSYIGYYLAPPLFVEFLRLSFPGTLSEKHLRLLWVASGTFTILTLFFPAEIYGHWNSPFHLVTLVNIASAFYGVIRAVRSRSKGSLVLLLASVLVTGATVNDVLYSEGLPSFGPVIHFALFVFILLQSFILSSQFSIAFAELAHTYREFTKIVYLHTVKQIASGFEIEKTMRVGTSEAVVLAFDIVGSSRIKHAGFADAVERMMGRCYDAMSHGYNEKDMHSRAYRVKEMGDGLLCSVGFPFPTGEGRSEAEVATALAEEFMRIFKEEIEKLELDFEAFCGIGIAKGSVEGFFPRFGVKQYDLRGKTIMLATRYEAMRNAVFHRMGWHGSVIFIQDDVYRDLSREEQALYAEWDATIDGQRIRDDAGALKAWYRFVPCAARKKAVDEVIDLEPSLAQSA